MRQLHPGLSIRPAKHDTRAVVLVLHGGKEHSHERSEPGQLSSRRVNPFARALHRRGAAHGVAVWKLRYRVRGWNAPERSPVVDALWALEEVRRVHGDVPVVLLGHSMGGRAAAHVLDDPSVIAMVALCPWLPDEPIHGVSGKQVLIAHAVGDNWTSPAESVAWAAAARPLATSLTYVRVRRTGHFMLRRSRLWTDLAVGFPLSWLDLDPSVGRRATNVLAQAATGVPLLTV